VLYGEDFITGGVAGVTVNLTTGVATDGFGARDVLISIENAYGTAAADSLTGNADANRLFGYGGNDTISGGAGNDILLGDLGNDLISGGDNDDEIWGEAGADTLDGGAGVDNVRYLNATAGVTVDLAAGTARDASGLVDRLISIEQVYGSGFADLLHGSAEANRLIGDAGNDTIQSLAGNDTISGGTGGDRYEFAVGDGYDLVNDLGQVSGGGDRIVFADYLAENASIHRQNSFDDTVVFDFGPSGDVVVVASALTWGAAGAIETFEFRDGTVWDQATMIAHLGQLRAGPSVPTAGNDILFGTTAADVVSGLTGDDQISGLAGADQLNGDDGNDILNGGDANDTLGGGIGNDQLFGGNGYDRLVGGDGKDMLYGQFGNDQLSGEAGSDVIVGGDGLDFIDGGMGGDMLTGGAGGDRFYHAGLASHSSDWVLDYSAAAGDILQIGLTGVVRNQFQVTFTEVVGMGQAGVAEAYVTYIPTGQVLWMLADGASQTQIILQIGLQTFDLLA
jgi:Ca2+-binding RTX toxin-like protein